MVDLTSSETEVEETPRYNAEAKLRSAFQTPSVLNRSAYLGSGSSRAEVLQGSAASIKRRKLQENGQYEGVQNHTAVLSTTKVPQQPKQELPEVFNCTWRKPQQKKHKTWDGDGWLLVHRKVPKVTLKCQDTGAILCTSHNVNENAIDSEAEFSLGGKDVQVIERIDYAQYRIDSGAVRTEAEASTSKLSQPHMSTQSTASYLRESNRGPPSNKPFVLPTRAAPKLKTPVGQPEERQQTAKIPTFYGAVDSTESPPVAKEGRLPIKISAGLSNPGSGQVPYPRHSPDAAGAIVMKRPSKAHQKRFNSRALPVVDVVVDPEIGRFLRPHQVEGVKFLYECVMGMRDDGNDSQGAILADEMGLGKTLQTIALIWTLLKQSCYHAPTSCTIRKAVIVCPLSLVKNWKREFRKWLGFSSLNVLCIDGEKGPAVRRFVNAKTYQVMIIGYERLRSCVDQLKDAQTPIDLIVCDEGHRLKSKDAKTTKMFEALATPRRVILSGTPIQNDLSEFFNMVDFVAPGLLGQYNVFKRVFEEPIKKSRVQNCGQKALQEGRERSEMLKKATQDIILRRTADLLADYLKPKTEMVVFCAPSPIQLQIYQQIVGSKTIKQSFRAGTFGNPLPLILTLRKLCNSPSLLLKGASAEEDSPLIPEEVAEILSSHSIRDHKNSGKLTALDRLLRLVRKTTDDKVVVVSNFTSTLDVIQLQCERRNWNYLRLDGKTKTDTRQELVNEFNRTPASSSFVFLLSAKSGGVGLNLIGANRLILFDSDWNPSTDKQAMARIHRDGQKKPCYIYRFLLAGTMDEKIYQRQISKIGLSDSLMDSDTHGASKASDAFSPEELKDIFTLHEDTKSLTHDLLQCECHGRGDVQATNEAEIDVEELDEEDPAFILASQHEQQVTKALRDKRAKLAALFTWGHFDCLDDIKVGLLGDEKLAHTILNQNLKHGLGTTSAKVAPAGLSLIDQLDQVETSTAAETQPEFNISSVPSGTILRVFQKESRSMTGTDAVADPEESEFV